MTLTHSPQDKWSRTVPPAAAFTMHSTNDIKASTSCNLSLLPMPYAEFSPEASPSSMSLTLSLCCTGNLRVASQHSEPTCLVTSASVNGPCSHPGVFSARPLREAACHQSTRIFPLRLSSSTAPGLSNFPPAARARAAQLASSRSRAGPERQESSSVERADAGNWIQRLFIVQ